MAKIGFPSYKWSDYLGKPFCRTCRKKIEDAYEEKLRKKAMSKVHELRHPEGNNFQSSICL